MDRRRMLHIFKTARECGPYDELPVFPQQFDLQLHLSRNERPQPFYLICDHDTLLIQMSGTGRVAFRETSVLYFCLEVGDFVYVPAGTPHRLLPDTESVQVRLKAQAPKLEGAAWFCERCGLELWREDWELDKTSPQEGYLQACEGFNASRDRRLCAGCGTEHAPVELDGLRWADIAADLKAETAEAAAV